MAPSKPSAGKQSEERNQGGERSRAEERSARMTPLAGLGPALRRLRMHRGLRQYEAAGSAGVTKAMLSAYETGKRNPSIRTLDCLLTALDASLGDLHLALVADRREKALLDAESRTSSEVREAPATWNERTDRGFTIADLDLGGSYPRWAPPGGAGPWRGGPDADQLYRALGVRGPLPPHEERAFREMLHGFLRLLRFMHHGEG